MALRFGHMIAVVFAAVSGGSLAGSELTPYKTERSGGIQSYITGYVLSSAWHIKCTSQVAGRGTGTKWCELTPVTGGKSPRSGIVSTSGGGPKVSLWKRDTGKPSLDVGLGSKPFRNSRVTVTIGETAFNKVMDPSQSKGDKWVDEEAPPIVKAMLAGKSVGHNYVNGARQRERGEHSLNGFEEAWSYATWYVGFDPVR